MAHQSKLTLCNSESGLGHSLVLFFHFVSCQFVSPEMLGVRHAEHSACDRKVSAQRSLLVNTDSVHVFHEMNDLSKTYAWCGRHSCECEVPTRHHGVCDLLVAGPPCTPFTQQRATRGSLRCCAACLYVTCQEKTREEPIYESSSLFFLSLSL